jgi:hypothetical protein
MYAHVEEKKPVVLVSIYAHSVTANNFEAMCVRVPSAGVLARIRFWRTHFPVWGRSWGRFVWVNANTKRYDEAGSEHA